jgi:hypothetical protein
VPTGTCAADVVAPSGTVCNPGSGDLCDPDEVCSGSAGQPCPGDTVAPASTVCRAAAGVCDVAELCTGTADQPCPGDAKASASTVCRAAAGLCDAAELCTGSSDTCPVDVNQPDGTSCSDGLFCNGPETCSAGTCTPGTAPCAFAAICSEGTDACLTSVCPSSPQSCRTPGKALLLIKNKADNSKDKLIWKWLKGAATTTAEFADPTATADYALCIYAGTTDTLRAQVHIPPSNTKWKATGTKGFKYKDATGTDDGTRKVVLKSGAAGKSKALVKGKGANLPDFNSDLPIAPGDLPLIVQLRNNQTGICWEGQFSLPKKNTADQFNAKTP